MASLRFLAAVFATFLVLAGDVLRQNRTEDCDDLGIPESRSRDDGSQCYDERPQTPAGRAGEQQKVRLGCADLASTPWTSQGQLAGPLDQDTQLFLHAFWTATYSQQITGFLLVSPKGASTVRSTSRGYDLI